MNIFSVEKSKNVTIKGILIGGGHMSITSFGDTSKYTR